MQAGGCRETQTQWSGEAGELPTARSALPTSTPLWGAQQLLQPEPAAGQAQLPWAVRRAPQVGRGGWGTRRSPPSLATLTRPLHPRRFMSLITSVSITFYRVIYTMAILLAEGFMQLTGICFAPVPST